jgi:tetratricopeptide (TPR) repeat protein
MNIRTAFLAVSVFAAAIIGSSSAVAHDPVVSANPDEAVTDVPLHSDLGNLSYPIDTSSERAQAYFDQGLRMTWAFNHAEALRSYRAAQRLDPDCAMCYWGEAFVLGPNINAPMEDAAGNPAVTAVKKAVALAHKPNEKALIEALALRYSAAADADRAAMDQAYARAVGDAARRFPDDTEIAVLYVDALMNTSPWDYWEADGVTTKGDIGKAISTAEKVLERNPNHPGAIHLYIHLTEASKHPEVAEPYADKLAALMPGAGHLVHMPAHTYYRIGRYTDSVNTNIKAVRVDEDAFNRMATLDIYRSGYYPHNIHFVVTSAQMAGDGPTALDYAKRLDGKISDDMASSIGWIQVMLAAPYFAHTQFSDPQMILDVPDPGNRYPYVKAMWHYSRGVALASRGNVEAARNESAQIAAINGREDFSMLVDWFVPAPDLLRIAQHVVEARIAQAEGDRKRAIDEFAVAVEIQDSLAYMEPPFWYYPVRQSLGAALLADGRAKEAVDVLEESLVRYPNNVYALYALEKACTKTGDLQRAQAASRRIRQASVRGLQDMDIERL